MWYWLPDSSLKSLDEQGLCEFLLLETGKPWRKKVSPKILVVDERSEDKSQTNLLYRVAAKSHIFRPFCYVTLRHKLFVFSSGWNYWLKHLIYTRKACRLNIFDFFVETLFLLLRLDVMWIFPCQTLFVDCTWWTVAHKLGMASSAACERGAEEQTVLQCPIHWPPHGQHGLTVLDDETTEWLLNTCPEIQRSQAVDKRTRSKKKWRI